MNIYLAHYLPLTERLEFMNMQFKNLEFNKKHDLQIITNEPSDDELSKLFHLSASTSDLVKIRQHPLTKSEMSLAYKHYLIYEQIAHNNEPYGFIIEDDAIFHKSFNSLLENSLKELQDIEWDVMFIGSGWSETQPNWIKQESKTMYVKEHPAARCTDSYLIKKESAKKLLEVLCPMHGPIDWELDRKMSQLNFKVLWRDPPIVKQGSQVGQYKETVRIEFKRV